MITLSENGLYRLLWGSEVYWFGFLTEALLYRMRLENSE